MVPGGATATATPARAAAVFAVAAAIAAVLVAGCVQPQAPANFTLPNSSVTNLGEVQVSDYQGERLSSTDDFRENSIKGPQFVNVTTYRLAVNGLVQNPQSYTYAQVVEGNAHYSKVVQLDCVEGWSVRLLWEGVLVRDLLAPAGVLPSANTIIFHAYDGYTTSFPLSYVMDNGILMAYGMNNATIPPIRGFPFMLVAEDKWGYKWIKWITQIELSNDPTYEGYWESRGYSNAGDLNGSFFGR